MAATCSGSTLTVYVNGVSVGTSSCTAPNAVTRTVNYIGKSNWAGNPNSVANFDEFRVWNTARTQAQIQASINASLTGSESGLLLYYKFDEGAGTVLVNSASATGAAYNGALVNSVSYAAPAMSSAVLASPYCSTCNSSYFQSSNGQSCSSSSCGVGQFQSNANASVCVGESLRARLFVCLTVEL